MRLFLCRHGNTFNAGDATVWTGSTNDLPLVSKGEEQAHNVAKWLRQESGLSLEPKVIFASHLQRVKRFAEIIKTDNEYNVLVKHDERLNEIDYGSWTGITDDAVADQFGLDSIVAWREKSEFPPAGQWDECEEDVLNRITSFVEELKKDFMEQDVFVVSSNGILRYFLKALDPNLFADHVARQEFQVKTGRMCLLNVTSDAVRVEFWNKDPNV